MLLLVKETFSECFLGFLVCISYFGRAISPFGDQFCNFICRFLSKSKDLQVLFFSQSLSGEPLTFFVVGFPTKND